MADIVDKTTRSRMMSGIRAKDTKPEMLVRRVLHAKGYRYRLHDRRLPGTPDIVLPRYRTVVEVRGCFWHYHGCRYSKIPESNTEKWQKKLEANRSRDARTDAQLRKLGWKVVVVWECVLRDQPKIALEKLSEAISGS